MHELGIGGIQGKNSKYHSYKKDNGEPKEKILVNVNKKLSALPKPYDYSVIMS